MSTYLTSWVHCGRTLRCARSYHETGARLRTSDKRFPSSADGKTEPQPRASPPLRTSPPILLNLISFFHHETFRAAALTPLTSTKRFPSSADPRRVGWNSSYVDQSSNPSHTPTGRRMTGSALSKLTELTQLRGTFHDEKKR